MERDICSKTAFAASADSARTRLRASGHVDTGDVFHLCIEEIYHPESSPARSNRRDSLQVVVVLSGSVSVTMNGRVLTMVPRDLVMILPSVAHSVAAAAGTKFFQLSVSPELLWPRGEVPCSADDLEQFCRRAPDVAQVIGGATGIPDAVLRYVRRIESERLSTSRRSRLSTKTYLRFIIVLLLNHYAAIGQLAGPDRRQSVLNRLKPTFDMIEARYHETIFVRDAARACGMSTSLFMLTLKEATGQTFLTHLNRFRVAKAQVLLLSTDVSVSEIAQETGYSDHSHFGVVFRKLVGVSPIAYRRQFRLSRETGLPRRGPEGSAKNFE